jgi:trehalose 6-phosphate synthase
VSGRLIVVSNRLAAVREGEAPVGGLAVAVLAALKDRGGIWLGWSGEIAPTPSHEPEIRRDGELLYATIDFTRRDHNEYYNGFANSVLWPLFHYRLGLMDFRQRDFEGYLRVNEQFARALDSAMQAEDTVWVHDYHLIPLGRALRNRGKRQPIGFFLHTPFPAPELMATLPRHAELMHAMMAYDLVGFQTEGDRSSFVRYMRAELGAMVADDGTVSTPTETTRTGVFPIGIETEDIIETGQRRDASPESRRLKRMLHDRVLIIGVDRLDYSKGLVERFRAFARLLELFPKERSRVTLMQIAPPSRANIGGYREIRHELEISASEINGRFSEFDWIPIRYINRSYTRNQLVSFYRSSRVGLVTPLRDGMNLVAKEFVAAQNPHDPGALVLSRFAGAAHELTEALIVNPFDSDEVAKAIHAALWMPREERIARWEAMIARLRHNDVHTWRRRFLDALAATARS